jgi:tripartite-type tricarboxylate transporter receptor subunit TctC
MRLLILFLLVASSAAFAQAYPNKPVRLIVTYPPGGSSDLMSRVYGAKLAELWGQQVIIESKPGAAGSIGMDFAAKQPNDGYTFVVGNLGPVAVNPLLSKVPYDIQKDFVAVSQISAGPNVLVVRADAPFRSLTSIIAYARVNPGKLNYGTSGPGSVSHLSSEMLRNNQKTSSVEVAYKGGVLAIQDLLGGQIDFIFSDSLPAMAHIRSGKLRALCVTGTQKYELLPEPPTCQEAAPGLVAVNWWGVLYPAGTPKAIVDKLVLELRKAIALPDVTQLLRETNGMEVVALGPDATQKWIVDNMARWGKVVKDNNIKAE